MTVDLHSWDTLEELAKREKFSVRRKWGIRRVEYHRTGRMADCMALMAECWPESVLDAKVRLVRDHVRPCV